MHACPGCIAAGFQSCCSDPSSQIVSSCFVPASNGGCYCDALCEVIGDCCFDVFEIGCFSKFFYCSLLQALS